MLAEILRMLVLVNLRTVLLIRSSISQFAFTVPKSFDSVECIFWKAWLVFTARIGTCALQNNFRRALLRFEHILNAVHGYWVSCL